MSDFINNQILSAINQRFGNIGTATALSFSGGNVSLTLELNGEAEPITLEVRELAWNTSDGKMNLHFSDLLATKPWVQEIFRLVAEKTNRVISFPDSLKLMPLKMMLPKKR